jgi:hypothetical protein
VAARSVQANHTVHPARTLEIAGIRLRIKRCALKHHPSSDRQYCIANVIDHVLNPVVSLRSLSSRGCHSFTTASASLNSLRSTFHSSRRSPFSPPILPPPRVLLAASLNAKIQGDPSGHSSYSPQQESPGILSEHHRTFPHAFRRPLLDTQSASPDGWKVPRAPSNGGGASRLSHEVISKARDQKPARWPECSHKHQACRMEQSTVPELRPIYMRQEARK